MPEELLPALYAGALAFVLPSCTRASACLRGGMASGVPVAASDRGALPEACGGPALHFDPDDADAMSEAVLRVATRAGGARAAARARRAPAR